uniref:Zinc finger protein MAGPIE n=1 Tax=Cajanus cajan TaxID=3821 RepID=A0A151SHJ4_CAJCA|nr:Zinc finger protein MAGPIE [Cajanus cajan]
MLNQQQQQQVVEENMSNLTSASGEASASSGNRTELGTSTYPQQYLAPPPTQTQPAKKKRNLPGNPDPDAEVIALSPKSLLATNRFICEICNKGFQRDQNLQLHRRGHNLPWKLKQRTSKEVRKKVYVCPEPTCVHHDPSRALGDLTGIKKHFCRKHGEKKWKCDKCSKKYAVQSDWKAHSKTCGTREYRCDCGTLFSRRDSFITHRAFCDALAEESARAMGAGTGNNTLLPPQPQPSTSHHITQFNPQDHMHAFPLKKEQQVPHMSATALLQKAAEMGATMTRPHHHAHVSSSAANNFGFNLSSREDTTTTTTTTTSTTTTATLFNHGLLSSHKAAAAAAFGAGNEGLTRDFLGLRPLSHSDILTIAGIGNCIHDQQNQSQKPWQG